MEPAYRWRWALAWCVCCLNLTLTISEQNQMLYKARGSMRPPNSVSYLNWACYMLPFVQLPAGWSPGQSRETLLRCLWRWRVPSVTQTRRKFHCAMCTQHNHHDQGNTMTCSIYFKADTLASFCCVSQWCFIFSREPQENEAVILFFVNQLCQVHIWI